MIRFGLDEKAVEVSTSNCALANAKVLNYTPIDVQYRVGEQVGAQWGLLATTTMQTGAAPRITVENFVATCANQDGKWKMITWSGDPVASPD